MRKILLFAAILVVMVFSMTPRAGAQVGSIGLLGVGGAPSGGGSPSVVQISGPITGNLGNCNSLDVTNPSTACTFPSNLGAGHNLVALITGAVTSWNTPTGSGAGCPSTWTAIGTANTNAAAYVSSATSAGACTVTLSAATSSAESIEGTVYEAANISTTADGTATIGGSYTFCSTCTGPSITTTASNDLVLTHLVGTAAPTFTGSWTGDISAVGSNSGASQGAAHQVLATAGTVSPTWTSSGGSGFIDLVALKP